MSRFPLQLLAALESYDSIGTVSLASDTTENQPGHGRILEQTYKKLGRGLENVFGRVVALTLPTPEALKRRIEAHLERWKSMVCEDLFQDLKKQWKEGGRPEWLEKVLTVDDADDQILIETSRWNELPSRLKRRVSRHCDLWDDMSLLHHQGASSLPSSKRKAIQRDCRTLVNHIRYAVTVHTLRSHLTTYMHSQDSTTHAAWSRAGSH